MLLVGVGVIAFVRPSAADKPSAIATTMATTTSNPAMTAIKPACTDVSPTNTATLGEKASVSLNTPNYSIPDPTKAPPAPNYACGRYVADITVPSTSKAPSGYTQSFVATASLLLTWVGSKADCDKTKSSVDIYKKSGSGTFTRVGGGDLLTSWVTSSPPKCNAVLGPGFKSVSGVVPASGSETYRFVFPENPPWAVATIERKAK